MSTEATQDFALAFLSILFEGAPFILLGTLISGFLDIYLPAGAMDRLLPKNRVLAVGVAGLLGGVFPVCECAVVPVIRRLIGKGLPVACALTYMLAAPIVNPITALSTWKAFMGQHQALTTCSRLLLGFLLATGVGLLVSRMPLAKILKPSLAASLWSPLTARPAGGGTTPSATAAPDRLLAAFRSALKDFVEVGVYFSIGVAITALFNTGLAPGAGWLDTVAGHPVGGPAALMALGFVLSLCSTSDAFIAATLAKFSWSAKLAFLTFGPMMDIKLVFLYQTVLNKRFIAWLGVGLFVAAGAGSLLLGHLLPGGARP
ncbi:MAG: permease [Akkermansiaceae bacterium]|jgi:hypothetical protein|nr:permease [Akkermansiaceae bacterium]